MAFNIEVIFTGLALFCMNEGTYCKDKLDTVYLVNATKDATVCDRQLDGGHEPVLSFSARHLLPGAGHDHEVDSAMDGERLVVSNLADIDLCICTESIGTPGCPVNQPGDKGAEPLPRTVPQDRRDPVWWYRDENSFDWVPPLSKLHTKADNARLCPAAETERGRDSLVVSRVRLDKGVVLTPTGWHDTWGPALPRLWRRIVEEDFLLWKANPVPANGQEHFPKALPGQVMWRIPKVAQGSVVLLQDCSLGRPQQTLFRLDPLDGDLRLHITNSPKSKHPLAAGAEMDHFRWYYRMVDWPGGGCSVNNASGCPDNLPLPALCTDQDDCKDQNSSTDEVAKENNKKKKPLESIITQTTKCPPASTG